jgi:hypothetical protein
VTLGGCRVPIDRPWMRAVAGSGVTGRCLRTEVRTMTNLTLLALLAAGRYVAAATF